MPIVNVPVSIPRAWITPLVETLRSPLSCLMSSSNSSFNADFNFSLVSLGDLKDETSAFHFSTTIHFSHEQLRRIKKAWRQNQQQQHFVSERWGHEEHLQGSVQIAGRTLIEQTSVWTWGEEADAYVNKNNNGNTTAGVIISSHFHVVHKVAI